MYVSVFTVQVTTSRVPSPVRVVRHWSPHALPPPPYPASGPAPLPIPENDKRFSSNFTTYQPTRDRCGGSDPVDARSFQMNQETQGRRGRGGGGGGGGVSAGGSLGLPTSLSLSHHLAPGVNGESMRCRTTHTCVVYEVHCFLSYD